MKTVEEGEGLVEELGADLRTFKKSSERGPYARGRNGSIQALTEQPSSFSRSANPGWRDMEAFVYQR